MRVLTIGFTKKSAERFFRALEQAGAKRVIDVRLNNVSQLSGFAKKNDLDYFLNCHSIEYQHCPSLAPTKEILDGYKKNGGSWEDYERKFLNLMNERQIEKEFEPEYLEDACLLCSEDKPHYCHRRLVAEYLQRHWGDFDIEHLG